MDTAGVLEYHRKLAQIITPTLEQSTPFTRLVVASIILGAQNLYSPPQRRWSRVAIAQVSQWFATSGRSRLQTTIVERQRVVDFLLRDYPYTPGFGQALLKNANEAVSEAVYYAAPHSTAVEAWWNENLFRAPYGERLAEEARGWSFPLLEELERQERIDEGTYSPDVGLERDAGLVTATYLLKDGPFAVMEQMLQLHMEETENES